MFGTLGLLSAVLDEPGHETEAKDSKSEQQSRGADVRNGLGDRCQYAVE